MFSIQSEILDRYKEETVTHAEKEKQSIDTIHMS